MSEAAQTAWHALTADEAVERLKTSVTAGLDDAETRRRQTEYGLNVLPTARKRGPFMRFLQQFNNVLVYVLLAAGFITFWASRPSVAKDRFLCLALGLILGGTLGNLYDRIRFHHVVDFLAVRIYHYNWPDFNVADSCIVIGACLLLLDMWRTKEQKVSQASEANINR